VENGALTEAAAAAPTETALAAVTTMTSIENYWMTLTARSPGKKSWNLDYVMISHICGDRRKFKQYAEFTNGDGWEICDVVGRVTGKAVGHGDIRLRL
jgi:hypothetical protein